LISWSPSGPAGHCIGHHAEFKRLKHAAKIGVGGRLTDAIDTASQAALNVERVNSLVYAVVMESRGVYMSTPAQPKNSYDALRKGMP